MSRTMNREPLIVDEKGRLSNGKHPTDDVGLDAVAKSHLQRDADLIEMAKADPHRAYALALSRAGEAFEDCLPSRNAPTMQPALDDAAIHRRALEIQTRDSVDYGTALRAAGAELVHRRHAQ
jgi:hypothetical protein